MVALFRNEECYVIQQELMPKGAAWPGGPHPCPELFEHRL